LRGRNRSADHIRSIDTWVTGRSPCSPRIGHKLSPPLPDGRLVERAMPRGGGVWRRPGLGPAGPQRAGRLGAGVSAGAPRLSTWGIRQRQAGHMRSSGVLGATSALLRRE